MVVICNDIMFNTLIGCVVSEDIDFLFNPMANRKPPPCIRKANGIVDDNIGPDSFYIIQANSIINERYCDKGHSTILGRIGKDWIKEHRVFYKGLSFVLDQINEEMISIVRLNKKYKDTTEKGYYSDPNITYENRILLSDKEQ